MADVTNNKNNSLNDDINEISRLLDELNSKLDSSNTKLGQTEDKNVELIKSFKTLAKVIDDLGSSFDKLDTRKTRKLETLSKHLKSVKASLEVLTSLEGNTDRIAATLNKLGEAMNAFEQMGKNNDLKGFATQLSAINKQLGEFVKWSNTLDAVSFDKLKNMNMQIVQGSTPVKPKNKPTEIEKADIKNRFIKKNGEYRTIDGHQYTDDEMKELVNGIETRARLEKKISSANMRRLLDAKEALGDFNDGSEKTLLQKKEEYRDKLLNEINPKKANSEFDYFTRRAMHIEENIPVSQAKSAYMYNASIAQAQKDLDTQKLYQQNSEQIYGKDSLEALTAQKKVIDAKTALNILNLKKEYQQKYIAAASQATKKVIDEDGNEKLIPITAAEKEENINKITKDRDKDLQDILNKQVLELSMLDEQIKKQKELNKIQKENNRKAAKQLADELKSNDNFDNKIRSKRQSINNLTRNMEEAFNANNINTYYNNKERKIGAEYDLRVLEAQKEAAQKIIQAGDDLEKEEEIRKDLQKVLEDILNERNEELNRLREEKINEQKIDKDILEEEKRKKATQNAQTGVENQESTNARTEFNAEVKERLARQKEEYAKQKARKQAFINLAGGGPLGIDTSKIADIMTALGSDSFNMEAIKAERARIQAEYDKKIREINNEEAAGKKQLRKDEKEGKITTDEKNQLIAKLRETSTEKRKAAASELETKMSENSDKLAALSSKISMWLAVASIAIKVMQKIWQLQKEAAKYNVNAANAQQILGLKEVSQNATTLARALNNLGNAQKQMNKSLGSGPLANIVGLVINSFAEYINIMSQDIDIFKSEVSDLINSIAYGDSNKPNRYNASDFSTSTKSEEYLKRLSDRLKNGIVVNGKVTILNPDDISAALKSAKLPLKSTGFDNESSNYMAGEILSIASNIKGQPGYENTNLSDIVSNIAGAVMGSNSATEYGFNVDEDTLTGYVAKMHELDMANVEYTDEMKEHWRLELIQHLAAMQSQEDRAQAIKQYKQLGDIMNTLAGTLYDFQEVQQATAKDFTIPEIGEGNALLSTENGLNEAFVDQNALLIKTSKGIMNLKDAYEHLDGELGRIFLVYNDLTNTWELVSDDYLQSLTQAERDHYTIVATGAEALAIYANMLKISDQNMIDLAEDAGFAEADINDLSQAVESLPPGEVHIDDNIEEVAQKVEELEQRVRSLKDALSGYSQNIQDYVNNGYAFADGSTLDDINFWQWLNGTINPWSVEDKKKVQTHWDFWKQGAGESANYPRFANTASWGLSTERMNEITQMALEASSGHADGGISISDHLARISEGNTAEAIIPLDSDIGVAYLSKALAEAGAGNEGVHVDNININNDVGIAEDTPTWNRVAKKMADAIATIQRREGDANYGIRK